MDCCYCGGHVPAEYEPEDGSTYQPSYHFACLSLEGPFKVYSSRTGRIVQSHASLLRAGEIADDLNGWNTPYNGTVFYVVKEEKPQPVR